MTIEEIIAELKIVNAWLLEHKYYFKEKIISGLWLTTDQEWIDFANERGIQWNRRNELVNMIV